MSQQPKDFQTNNKKSTKGSNVKGNSSMGTTSKTFPASSVPPSTPMIDQNKKQKPPDQDGYQYLHVFKLFPSRLVALYPSKDLTAQSLASAAFQFFVTYGVMEVLMVDPGSNINSEVVRLLLSWFGIKLRISLVSRHESCGVERTNKEVLRLLSTLINDERLKKNWSDPQVILTVQLLLNESVNAEIGVSPFEYVFGTLDKNYFHIPKEMDSVALTNEYMVNLNNNIQAVRHAANQVQEEEHLGPYRVLNVNKADITCKHLVTGAVSTFHMDHLKMAFLDEKEAYKVALVDYDQFEVDSILGWKGDPRIRKSMSFQVKFKDGDIEWLPYTRDLYETVPFEDFVRKNKILLPLLYTQDVWKKLLRSEWTTINGINIGDKCYIDLSAWGQDYFQRCMLPEVDKRYVVEGVFVKWVGRNKRKITVTCKVFNQSFDWDSFSVYAYGGDRVLTDQMIKVDDNLIRSFPNILLD